jgi:hypothetical protein
MQSGVGNTLLKPAGPGLNTQQPEVVNRPDFGNKKDYQGLKNVASPPSGNGISNRDPSSYVKLRIKSGIIIIKSVKTLSYKSKNT